jgi:TatD DNase family protein
MELIDTHAHLTNNSVFGHVDEVLERAQKAHIGKIINICTDKETLERGLELAKRFPWIYNVAATTPHDVEKEGEELFPLMTHHAKNGDLIAVGETGLDYHYEHSPREIQKVFFKKYLGLAMECKLPVVIHCRDAFKDFFEIIDAEFTVGGKHAPGVLHCFTGSLEDAKNVINRGWYLSLSGIVTFKKSQELREVAKLVPLDQLLIETDTPYLAPQSHRGKMNEPSFLPETVQLIAALRNLPFDHVARATLENAYRLFNIGTVGKIE